MDAVSKSVSTLNWRSSTLPRGLRFAVYREEICRLYNSVTPDVAETRAFEASVRGIRFDGGQLSLTTTTPMILRRTASDLTKMTDESFSIRYTLRGRAHSIWRDEARVERIPGTATLQYNNWRFCSEAISPQGYAALTIRYPLDTLARLSGVEPEPASLILAAQPHAAALHALLDLIAARLPHADMGEMFNLYRSSAALAAVVLCAKDEAPSSPDRAGVGGALLACLKRFVDTHLADVDLSPSKAAGGCGISVRYLHKLFEKDGTSFSTFLTSSRVDRLKRALSDPTLSHVPVADLARACGFGDQAVMHRGFKSRVGITPGQYRRLRRSDMPDATVGGPGSDLPLETKGEN